MKKLLLSILLLQTSYNALQAQSYVPERQQVKMKVKAKVPVHAYSFNLKDVQLLDGPFKRAQDADVAYLLLLEPDRFLADFREHSGLKAKAKRYGGWESSGLAGHSLGHYLSACAMHYAASGDKRFLDKVNYIVSELAECQQHRKTGYIGAIPNEDSIWQQVSEGHIRSRGFDLNGGWSPWYTVHKIMAGLLDAYLYCNNRQALAVEKGMADWTGQIVGHLPDSLVQKMLLCEYGGMNEALVNTYALTGEKKYLDLSYKFHDRRVLDSLAMQQDILPGKHSNTQIPKIIGCVRRFELTGADKDSIIGRFFWNTVTQHHSYAPGGNSNYEYLGPPDQLNDFLTENTMETCNTYNMLKLTRHLFALQPAANLMDFYERALYNHILSSQNHHSGMMCYFVPLRMGTRKEFSDSFHTFTCCVGSGMENHVKYGESIYFEGADGSLYVNLFIPSRLTWQHKGVTVEQQTKLPAEDKVTFTITAKQPAAFALRIRKPHWVQPGMQLTVNGKAQPLTTDEEGYITVNRTWKTGDKVQLLLPMDIYTEAMPDNPGRIALFYGPVVLAGQLGDKEPDPVTGIPVFVTSEKDPNQWLRRDDPQSLVFHTSNIGKPADVTLVPFNSIQNEWYSVYWDAFTPEGWTVQQAKYEAEKKRQKEIETRTVDALRIAEMQPERDHNFTVSDKTTTGEEHGKKWRAVWDGGYMQFTMKVNPDKDNSLQFTYWGMDNRYCKFDILVDGEQVATEDLNKFKASKFYDIVYPIPSSLTKGKQTVTIKLQARKNNHVGPVYGTIRMMQQP
jgi:DUF1680 family protein